jgi:hypothetical protein
VTRMTAVEASIVGIAVGFRSRLAQL